MEIWGVDENGVLRGNWWDGNWQGWYSLPTPTATPSGFRLRGGGFLSMVGRDEDHMELWSVGTDKKVHGIWWDGDWQNWYTLDGQTFPAGAPIVALSRKDDHMEVYSVNEANSLQGIWWDGNWQFWHALDPLAVANGTPLAGLSRGESHLELWCVAPAGAPADDVGVQGIWFDGSVWRGFYRVV
jgi:hypothetical protein